jgi:hypothetical protein
MTHDWVVKKIALFHHRIGDDVCADHYPGFRKPPISIGSRGAKYIPDIWVGNKGILYEVEPYSALKNSLSQVKAFAKDTRVKDIWVVISSGTFKGIERLEGLLQRKDVDALVINWRDLFEMLGINW